MPDKTWKAVERRIARDFGTERAGPQGKAGPDIDAGWIQIEAKHMARVEWNKIMEGMAQVMGSGRAEALKAVAVHKKGDSHYYLVIRDDEMLAWTGLDLKELER